jgi:hypothetical protein
MTGFEEVELSEELSDMYIYHEGNNIQTYWRLLYNDHRIMYDMRSDEEIIQDLRIFLINIEDKNKWERNY